MHALPIAVGRVAEHASQNGTRFALDAVRIDVTDDAFAAEATDTRHLVRITGPVSGKYPYDAIPALATAPNSALTSLVPAAVLGKTFASAKRMTKSARLDDVYKAVAVVLGETVTTFGATDGKFTLCDRAENVPGKFPPTHEILPHRNGVAHTVLPISQLIEILKTASEVSPGGTVTIEIYGPHQPVAVRTRNGETGLVMSALSQPIISDFAVGHDGKEWASPAPTETGEEFSESAAA